MLFYGWNGVALAINLCKHKSDYFLSGRNSVQIVRNMCVSAERLGLRCSRWECLARLVVMIFRAQTKSTKLKSMKHCLGETVDDQLPN